MPTVLVNVDVDLDDIDTDDLVDEMCRRIKQSYGKKSLSDKEKNQIRSAFAELWTAISFNTFDKIEIKTLDDKMKYEHLSKVFGKYNSSQIEEMIPL